MSAGLLEVAADLALALEAQVALVFRLAHAADRAATDPREAAYALLLTRAVKFLVCKSTPQVVYESLECLGGNGYTEDLPLARYYREAPLNAIWEGSGNVMALDVLRAAGRHPEAAMDALSRLVRTASQAFNVAPLAEAGSAFAPLYGETRLGAGHFAQFGTADLGSNETGLMERALAV